MQAEYGATLRSWGRDTGWFYKGSWPAAAVKLANDNGGTLVARDFETFARSSVDPRFSPAILCTLKQRGVTLTRAMPYLPPGMVDTGFPTLVTIAPGRLRGMTPEMSYIEGVAAGD